MTSTDSAGMMDCDLIENSKENIQPLRRGRRIKTLVASLKQKVGVQGDSQSLQEKRHGFEQAIKKASKGSDPLAPWLKYIAWTQASYTCGGLRSHLIPLLEACTKKFMKDGRYTESVEFLRVWVMYADYVEQPLEIYEFLNLHGIGTCFAVFYEAWAMAAEGLGKHSLARRVLMKGLSKEASPKYRLTRALELWSARATKRQLQQAKDAQNNAETSASGEDGVPRRALGVIDSHREAVEGMDIGIGANAENILNGRVGANLSHHTTQSSQDENVGSSGTGKDGLDERKGGADVPADSSKKHKKKKKKKKDKKSKRKGKNGLLASLESLDLNALANPLAVIPAPAAPSTTTRTGEAPVVERKNAHAPSVDHSKTQSSRKSEIRVFRDAESDSEGGSDVESSTSGVKGWRQLDTEANRYKENRGVVGCWNESQSPDPAAASHSVDVPVQDSEFAWSAHKSSRRGSGGGGGGSQSVRAVLYEEAGSSGAPPSGDGDAIVVFCDEDDSSDG